MEEINATIKDEAALEVGGKGEIGLPMILNLFSSLKVGITGTNQRATKIRNTFKNRFSDFASKFNAFIEEQNNLISAAVEKFEEFVYKRIAAELFDLPETVKEAIRFGGGSPRELLRLLEYANIYADDEEGIIDLALLDVSSKSRYS